MSSCLFEIHNIFCVFLFVLRNVLCLLVCLEKCFVSSCLSLEMFCLFVCLEKCFVSSCLS